MGEVKNLPPIDYVGVGALGQTDNGEPYYHEWSDASGNRHWVEDGLNDSITSADESELAGEVLRLASVVRGYQFLCADRDHSIDVLNTAVAEARAEAKTLASAVERQDITFEAIGLARRVLAREEGR